MNRFKMQTVGLFVLRIGLALVFLWFGTQQILHPDKWTALVPIWAHVSFLTVKQLVLLNGVLEIVAAIFLILNFWTRIVALLLALHLFSTAFSFGLNPTGVRDFGLAMSTLALFFLGPNKL